MAWRYHGYHTTKASNAKSIIDNGFTRITYDDDFLGSGVYLWDSKGSYCHWWARIKKIPQYVIIYTEFVAEGFLDLTDPEIINELDAGIKAIQNKIKCFFKCSSGQAIDMFCRHYNEPYDVIRGAFPVARELDTRPFSAAYGRVPIPVKLMYCVRRPEILVNCRVVFPEQVG